MWRRQGHSLDRYEYVIVNGFDFQIAQPGRARTKKGIDIQVLARPGCQMKTYGFQAFP